MSSGAQKRKGAVVSTPKKSDDFPLQGAGAPDSSGLRNQLMVLLPLLSLAGFVATFGLAVTDGSFDTLETLAKQTIPLFPGSTHPLLMHYTGIAAIDRQLTVLVAFFAPVVDESHGGLTLLGRAGVGQFGAAFGLMMLEALRQGNKGRIISYVGIFGLIFQRVTYAVTVPIWALLHILTSPTVNFRRGYSSDAQLVSKVDLAILPFSITLGYLVPSLLMALPTPSVASYVQHQQLIALWQPFPLWCVLIQYIGRFLVGGGSSKKISPQHYVKSSNRVYQFLVGLCILTHLPSLAIATIPPSSFPPELPIPHEQLVQTFSSVYVPKTASFSYKATSFAEGVHIFLTWDLYIGSAALLLWGLLLHQNSGSGGVAKAVTKTVFWTALAGPIGALTVLLWERDQVLAESSRKGQ